MERIVVLTKDGNDILDILKKSIVAFSEGATANYNFTVGDFIHQLNNENSTIKEKLKDLFLIPKILELINSKNNHTDQTIMNLVKNLKGDLPLEEKEDLIEALNNKKQDSNKSIRTAFGEVNVESLMESLAKIASIENPEHSAEPLTTAGIILSYLKSQNDENTLEFITPNNITEDANGESLSVSISVSEKMKKLKVFERKSKFSDLDPPVAEVKLDFVVSGENFSFLGVVHKF
ncbi:hypothetical protein OAC51_08795 [Flavobacteriaceae bacterium]|nr:hypothetical protein [Flavobacteriaceae bacterium]